MCILAVSHDTLRLTCNVPTKSKVRFKGAYPCPVRYRTRLRCDWSLCLRSPKLTRLTDNLPLVDTLASCLPGSPYACFFSASSFFASRIASLSLPIATSTSSSGVRLKDARTYAVFLPFGRNAVPGRARTPRLKAVVSMTALESPSSDGSSERRSLNLRER